jgi:diketogulonate reductase-like aldo/keto reductase
VALWHGLQQTVAQGLVRSIGVSNYSPAELAALQGAVPAVNQCEMSVEGADNDTLAYCTAHGIKYQIRAMGQCVAALSAHQQWSRPRRRTT